MAQIASEPSKTAETSVTKSKIGEEPHGPDRAGVLYGWPRACQLLIVPHRQRLRTCNHSGRPQVFGGSAYDLSDVSYSKLRLEIPNMEFE